MTPVERQELLTELRRIEQNLGREINDLRGLLTDQNDGLIHRVRGLELWKARWEGSKTTLRWVGPVSASIAGGATSALIVVLATHAH